ncbi:MAG: radical SAM protein [Myxococcota bacterium]
MDWSLIEEVRRRKDAERGARHSHDKDVRVALVYPSPYHVGMSSLGFQTLYRLINEDPALSAERAFLPDDVPRFRKSRMPLFTYETETHVGDLDLFMVSVAYELELPGLFEVLELSGLPVLARERGDRFPLVVVGGPLTFSNPMPLGPFVDVVVMGEAEEAALSLLHLARELPRRDQLLERLSQQPGFYVPSVHGEHLPGILAAPDERLPAYSALMTPHTELSDMFLVEAERGCSRGCTFCVMRRSTNGGMRLVTPEKLLSLIPADAKKVGLVGAAVSDHPRLPELVRTIVESGRGLGISSLRADKMTPELLQLFRQGGYRQLTVASDGASERLRRGLERRIQEKHLMRSAELAAEVGMAALKVYMMIGVPGETDDDIEELIRFIRELSKIIPVALGVSPFVSKRNTPLDGSPFEEIPVLERRLKRMAQGIRPRAEVRSTSARWAWVEYRLAQGGWSAGLAIHRAWREGYGFAAIKRAMLEEVGKGVDPPWRRGLPPPADVLSMDVKERIRPTVMASPSALLSV